MVGASLPVLLGLVDKSLLHRAAGGRYQVHELLRQYAEQQLEASDQADAIRDSHSDYFCHFLHQREKDLKGERQMEAAGEIEDDLKNCLIAWQWASHRRKFHRLREAMDCLGIFYERWQRYYPGRNSFSVRAVDTLLSADDGDKRPELSGLLAWQYVFSRETKNLEQADKLLQDSLTLLQSPKLAEQDTRMDRAFVLQLMGSSWGSDASPGPAKRKQLLEQSLAPVSSLRRLVGHGQCI